jgi:hypothetical protein
VPTSEVRGTALPLGISNLLNRRNTTTRVKEANLFDLRVLSSVNFLQFASNLGIKSNGQLPIGFLWHQIVSRLTIRPVSHLIPQSPADLNLGLFYHSPNGLCTNSCVTVSERSATVLRTKTVRRYCGNVCKLDAWQRTCG